MNINLLAATYEVPIERSTMGNPYPWSFHDLGQLLSILLQTVIIVAGLGALIFLILAGIQFLTSGGEKVQMEAARGRITAIIIGLVVVSGAYALTRVIETIFGISIVSGIKWPGP